MRIYPVAETAQTEIRQREAKKPESKDFETVLAEAMEKQKRIHEDFDRLRVRQSVRTDNLYGDGAFKPI